ncbi:hypothetical protein [Streptomyces sp. HPF1205]|uniref:hypothetical protein n=1 Tax=Streptomyces sp. HPF1205 TaxID=2873262 RepID=UPI001CEDA8B1|nr:hypothetical protein [Streptomyces sp. HPF1205]
MPSDPYRAVAALVRAEAARSNSVPLTPRLPHQSTVPPDGTHEQAQGHTRPDAEEDKAPPVPRNGPRRYGRLRAALAALLRDASRRRT